MKKVYYAHCVALYDTPQEERDMLALAAMDFVIYNPNNAAARNEYPEQGMAYFEKMVKCCDGLAFRALPDGRIPAGVHAEIRWALEAGLFVFELPNALIGRGIDVEATREYLRDAGER